ncbi:restriction endonuclease [Streptomyces brasiliscabiei]|uniref:restriction endonuclease n=1 Tax=Streptomyces brasiliscabiei TaxID=2736302 RepID=UPI001C0FEDAD|nr:restriction endonuclease [Streptomyces brasiliscabiei]
MDLRRELEELDALAGGLTPQDRGRRFEKWLIKLLARDNLAPRPGFRPEGEEVDGSFRYGGRYYLLEAKWWAETSTVPASAIYQFKGKVDGKLVGTIGVFISMSGYSDEAVDALRVGKDLNVILFNRSDVEYAADRSFAEVLEFKLREAAELGEVFAPYKATVAPPPTEPKPPLTIVVEGRSDTAIIGGISEALRARGDTVRRLNFIEADGVEGLARVAAIAARVNPGTILIVADSDGVRTTIPRAEQLDGHDYEIIIVAPRIEKWLGMATPSRSPKLPWAELARRAAAINLDETAARDEQFARLIKWLTS